MTHFLNIIILLGTIQGIINSVLLFKLKPYKLADKLLAWIILLISLACLNIYILETVESNSSLLNILEAIIPLVIIMPIGPLIYFYVKAILNPEFKIERKKFSHFYSTILDLIPNLAVLIFIIGRFFGFKDFVNGTNLGHFIETYNLYVDIPRWLSLVIYIIITFKLIQSYKNDESNIVFKKWAQRFTIGFALFSIIWLLHLIIYIIPSLFNSLLSTVGWYPVYIPLIVLVYWLGINGFIIRFKTYEKNSQTHNIKVETVENTKIVLNRAMENDQLYLNASLKLSDVVKHTKIPQKTISAVLNQNLNKSFNDYINTFRIEAFKKRLLENNSENLTITGIAFECGFNSQATFQRAFKANTNLSPSEFKKTNTKN